MLLGCALATASAQAQTNFQSIQAQQTPGLLTNPGAKLPNELRDSTEFKPKPQEEIQLDMPDRKAEKETSSVLIPAKQVRIEGVTLFKPEELKPIVEPYIGKEQTLSQLNALTQAIADLYHKRGYLTAEAYLPPQDIVDGVLTIRVQEGRAGKISIEGSKYYRAKLVKHMLSQKPGEVLNFKVLEQELNRSNRLSENYQVKAFLAAGDKAGQTDLHIRMAERQPLQITGVADNQGRPMIGLYRGGIDVQSDSLTGNADRFSASWRANPNIQIAYGSYSLPLNRFGTTLSTNGGFVQSHVVLPVQNPPDIMGRSISAGVTLSQPLDRERHFTLDTGLVWNRVNSFFDGDLVRTNEVRAWQTGLNFSRYDRWGRTFNRVESTVAFGGARDTQPFWKLENYAFRVFTLPKGHLFILRSNAQLTPDGLPSSQQFQIGGVNSVRGYTEGLLFGDRGINLGAEYRFPLPTMKLPIAQKLQPRIHLSLFYDYGRVWMDHSNPLFVKGISTLPQRTTLQSVGFGVNARLTRFIDGFVNVGFGLVERSMVEPLGTQPTARVHFGIRSNLLSEAYAVRPSKPVIYEPRLPVDVTRRKI
jgi:hemolysin activation/secretion protein